MPLDIEPVTPIHEKNSNEAPPSAPQELVIISIVSYVLLLIVAIAVVIPGLQFSLVMLLASIVIDMVKFGDSRGTIQEAHFRWRFRSVCIAGILYVATIPLFLVFFFPGMLAWCVISLWFLYRVIIGISALNGKYEPKGYF